jgi:S-adenosylmethionine hydrolase
MVAKIAGQYLVLPNNGLLTHLTRWQPLQQAHRVEHTRCFADVVSATFHGRDVFAPTAAELLEGLGVEEVGPPLDDIVYLEVAEPYTESDGAVFGEIIHVDRFGNLITNIPSQLLPEDSELEFWLGEDSVRGLRSHYAAAEPGEPLALIGSSGHLEIAVNRGNAGRFFGAGRGSRVRVEEVR